MGKGRCSLRWVALGWLHRGAGVAGCGMPRPRPFLPAVLARCLQVHVAAADAACRHPMHRGVLNQRAIGQQTRCSCWRTISTLRSVHMAAMLT